MTRGVLIPRPYWVAPLVLGLLVLWCAPMAAGAQDTVPTAGTTANPAPSATQVTTVPARFGLLVEAPDALKSLLLKHLDLQRFRTLSDLDAPELARLLRAAPDNVRDLLATQGYFSPQVHIDHQPAIKGESLGEVRIRVAPGARTRVDSAAVYFAGDIAHATEATEQRQAIAREVQQDVGKPFSQSAWDATKSSTLRAMTAQRYPRARLVNSLSDIDAEAALAHWHLEVDSGDPVFIGEVRVDGALRYDPVVAQRMVRLAGLQVGADYSLSQLQAAQQQIAESAYYTSVYAYADLDPAAADDQGRVPVVVKVNEALPQKVVFGVGGSTDSGARLSFEHSHLRVPGIDWRAHNTVKLDSHDQSWVSDWNAPIDDKGWHWLVSGSWKRQIDGTTTTRGLRLSAGRSQETAALDRRYYLQLDRARTLNSASTLASSQGNETALSANMGWTWRRFDNIPYPDSGYGLGLNIGAGVTLNPSRHPFVTTHARWLTYWPLGERVALVDPLAPEQAREAQVPTRSANGRLALRLEGGAVLASEQAPIPDTLLYLAGGDNSVRGYGLRDIGVVQADGSVTAGRYLTAASLEWQRPIWRRGERTAWESVVFVDAGSVSDGLNDTTTYVGTGLGARYNSPVGPVQMDLAYGVNIKRFRLHLNVGFTF